MPPKSKNIKNELEGSDSESGDDSNAEGYSDYSHHRAEVEEEIATIAGLGQLADIVAGEVQHHDEDDAGSLAEPEVKSEPDSTAPTGSKAAILNLFSLFSVFPKPSL